MNRYPGFPGDDTDGYTLEGAKAISRNCGACCGQGLTPIYRKDYSGSPVEYLPDRDGRLQGVAMRSVAYCTCPAGRKILILHQGNNNAKLLMFDIHDVIAGNHAGWVSEDPTYDPNEAIDIQALPEALRAMAAKLALPKPRRESA